MGVEALTMACLLLVGGSASLDVTPINNRAFDIPIRIEPERRAEIRELVLLVSTDQARTWNKVAVASPDQSQFGYQAPSDGVYWFSIVVVDKEGKQDPPNPYDAPVGLKILVDTLQPQLRISAAERSGEDVVVRWEITDQNIDLASLRLQYRGADGASASWTPVSFNPAVAGQTTFRAAVAGALQVRMEVQDFARNSATAQADVQAGFNAGAATVGYAPGGSSNPPPPTFDRGPIQPPPPVIVNDPPPRERMDAVNRAAPSWNGGAPGQVVASTSNHTPAATAGMSNYAVPRPPPSAAPLRVVNNNRVTLDYEVMKLGPSGVGSVELYVTRDEGRGWQKISGEQNIGSPSPNELQAPGATMRRSLTVDLPEDGIYGFYMIVRNGAGLGKAPPQNGDLPQMRVEVDRVLPEAWLFPLRPDPNRRDALVFSWKVVDRNLAANPITLQWAPNAGGPWQVIGAAELPNTGQYVWQVPPGIPPRVYLRLGVRDTAGNSGVAETPEPILVDLTEPDVRILSVGGANPR